MNSDPEKKQDTNKNQGEGDRESAQHYNEATREFIESGKVEQAARKAEQQDSEEAERSERAGKARAREVDPAVHRDYDEPKK